VPAAPLRRRPSWSLVVDVAVGAWVVLWLALGVAAADEVRGLSAYGDALRQAGAALDTAGSGLQRLGAVPFVGDGPERLGDEVRATAEEVRRSAGATDDRIEALGGRLGLAVATVPTLPVLAVHLPRRIRREREVAAVRRLAASLGDDRMAELLARRALHHAPYRVLAAAGADPWRDVEEGRYRRLADAELARLGLARAGRRPS
jgi:hypothetical protein